MKGKTLFLSLLSFCLITVSIQQHVVADEKFTKATNCIKAEGFSDLTSFVLDLYYNKITFKHFISGVIEMMPKLLSDIDVCLLKNNIFDLKWFKSSVSKVGFTLLYSSNCQKDLGPTLIIFDNVIQSLKNIKTEWKTALTNAFMGALLAKQSLSDCKDAYEAIKQLWQN
jgi:hypothetical protein